MKIQSFPSAVIATATFTFWISSTTPVAAQGPTFGPVPPPSNPLPATERVQLSSGAEEVLKLARAKVNDEVTVAFIQSSDRRFNLTASEILYLKKEGVSDRVLTAMLIQQSPTASEAPAPASSPAPAPEASAPQYVASPGSATFLETAPASTVYLATAPSYYSFYDPWPYWSSWYAYPAFSLGFYWGWGWGGCGYWGYPSYCNNGYWNNHCYNGYYGYNGYNGNPPPPVNGNRPPAPNGTGNPSSINGRTGGQGTLAADGRQLRGASPSPAPTTTTSGSSRIESRTAGAGSRATPTSFWSNNGNQPAATRTDTRQANATVSSQATRPSLGSSGVNTRTAAGRPNASSTSVWSGNTRQESPRATVNQRATSSARPGSVSPAPTAVGSRPVNQSANSYSARPTMNYQRSSSVSPSYNYRSSGGASSMSRPSMSQSYSRPSMPSSSSRMGSAGASRGGGSFSGAGASRGMSSGGGSRGGGGGGRSR